MEAKSEASIASCLPLVIADPDDIDASLRQLAALEARDHAHKRDDDGGHRTLDRRVKQARRVRNVRLELRGTVDHLRQRYA